MSEAVLEKTRKKKYNSEVEKQLDQAQEQFDQFQEQVQSMTLDRMNEAKKQEQEPTHKLSQKDIENAKDHYLKPSRGLGSKEPFNEKFRQEWEYAKEYVRFIAENKEIIGETIEIWTKPFPGVPCEYWQVPVGKPIWGPRYLAEQIKRCSYHRLTMENHLDNASQSNVIGSLGNGTTMYGKMVVDSTLQRLDALPISTRKSIFMGAGGF